MAYKIVDGKRIKMDTTEISELENSRLPPSPTEIESKIQEEIDLVINRIDENRSIDRALSQAIFILLNEVRELKSQTPVTPAQFKNWLRQRIE